MLSVSAGAAGLDCGLERVPGRREQLAAPNTEELPGSTRGQEAAIKKCNWQRGSAAAVFTIKLHRIDGGQCRPAGTGHPVPVCIGLPGEERPGRVLARPGGR